MERKAKALYNYNATRENEVAMKRGDNLIILSDFGEWTYVSNLAINKRGMVPTNYIRELTETAAPSAQQSQPSKPAEAESTKTADVPLSSTTTQANPASNASSSQKLDVAMLQELTSKNDGIKYGIVTRTLTDTAGGKALSVKEGDIVMILDVYPTGWTNVVLVTTGAKGLISKQHYVEYKSGDPLPAQFTASQQQEQQQQQSQPQSQQQQQGVQKRESIPADAIKFAAIAKFDYASKSESELAFKENDRVEILKDDVPGGWWLALLNGKIGHVPPGYFEKVVPQPPSESEAKKTGDAPVASIEPKKDDSVTNASGEVSVPSVNANNGVVPVAEVKNGETTPSLSNVASTNNGASDTPVVSVNVTVSAPESNKSDNKNAVSNENNKPKAEEDKKNVEGSATKMGVVKELAEIPAKEEDDEETVEETHDPKGELPDCPFEATAIYDYNASGNGEVSLVMGEIVTVVSYALLGWITVNKTSKDATGPLVGHVPRDWISALDNAKYNKVDVSDNPDDFYKALYEFNSNGPSQVSLKAGDIVHVISKENDRWWQGISNGKVGFFPKDFVRELTAEEKMDKFGVSPTAKTVFPKTEAEYAAAAEYAEKLHDETIFGEEKVNKELEAGEVEEPDNDDGRIIMMAKVIKKYKPKDGVSSPLVKGDIVEIEEMIAEKKLWRINFQGISLLVPKAILKLLTPDETKKLSPSKRPPPVKTVNVNASISLTSTPQKSAATPQKPATTATATTSATSSLSSSSIVPPPSLHDEDGTKSKTTDEASIAKTTQIATTAEIAKVDDARSEKDELKELLARKDKEHEEADKAMDAKIAALEAVVAEREAMLQAIEEKLAQAKKLQEARMRLDTQAKKLRNEFERELACKREIDGLMVRVRMTIDAKGEKAPGELTAEDLAF